MSEGKFGELETRLGFNHCENGLLLDTTIRVIYKPVDHTLRDWMHTFCSDGVANSAVGGNVERYQATWIHAQHVTDFHVTVHNTVEIRGNSRRLATPYPFACS